MFYSSPQRNYTLVLGIAIVSILTIALFWGNKPKLPLISPWSAQSGNAPIKGITQRIADQQLRIEIAPGLYADQQDSVRADLTTALAYVSERFGSGPSMPLTVMIEPESSCNLNGVAYTDTHTVHVYSCDSISRGRAVAILAHEFIHQLAQDRYGPAHLKADLILSEGLATWGAGSYWLGGQPDFRSYVAAQQRQGVSYPLAMSYVGQGVDVMNALYYQWASFVEFLIQTYGRERFDALYVSGANAPGSADYAAVYGKPLDVLEAEWKTWLQSR